ncbi:MAG: hypothetical protein KGQ70_09765, partial [Alphaproteobacteria bacterium]|nr:hypothetical protein [Alphaproteobacteria bacterium]
MPFSTGRMFAGIFSCAQPHAPPVTIVFHDSPPRIEAAQPAARMESLRKKSISPDYGGAFTQVDGLTDGTFGIKYDLDFTAVEQMMLHTACVRAKDARIAVTYTPVIYVSDVAAPGSCRYKATLAHEMRHVGADIGDIEEFLPKIKAAADAALAPQHDPRPVSKSAVVAFQADESKKLSDAIGKISAALQRTRQIRQMQIDTRREYERLSKACPRGR